MAIRIATASAALAFAASSALAVELGDPRRGRAYAEQNCATCHAVKPGEILSPAPGLASFENIANAEGMTAMAISTWLQTPHRDMPNFVIPAETRLDIVAYITSLKAAPVPK